MSTSSAAFNVVSVASTAANVVANPRQNVSSVGTASTSTLPSAASPVGITWSYMQLRDLLIRASNDEAVYRHAYGKIYCVQMKQIGPKLHFNIDKKPVKEKTKGDKVRL